ncbi:hypothetical protein [Citrobacter meridianamericanus]|uniref:Ead/Ea22-like family protein n=1 Tax=Citrobacter meridianamericanus TaxID=2894201 RepID=A0ABT1B4V6_9ENTR|nr:hypothetical protein [Citrobacter meridianamericanus]MCO5780620.1 hypothetical protein [Citrobacter meridianamericanus]
MNVYEMEGFLRGKCLPGDMKVNESDAQYLVRKLSELQSQNAELAVQLANAESKCRELAAESAYLLNGAARELNTSWMFHKTMLGAQAALVCLAHGYQAAAREWLEGTTDEAGAEIPDDISVGELPEWFDSQMVSNDGKSGFLTRAEAEEAIRKACPETDAFLAEVRASGVDAAIEHLNKKFTGTGHIGVPVMALEWLAQEIREGGAA